MFEAPQKAYDEARANELEIDALDSLNTAFAAPQVAPPAAATNPGFQLPKSLWMAMLGAYGVFFAAILGATGGSGHAIFAIVVSVLYTAIYFGVARVGARQAGPEAPSPLERGEDLQTWTGPTSLKAVYGQVLIVPAAIAIFGLAILTITIAL